MNYTYTTVDRVFSMLHRDLKGADLHESDVIEWIGEALEFLKTPGIQEEAVAFLEVKSYEADLPDNLQMVIQIAKYDEEDLKESCKEEEATENETEVITTLCGEQECYKPYFDMQWQYVDWSSSIINKKHFMNVRLANNTLFNTIVCKNTNLYEGNCGEHEYTIVGTFQKKIRLSFEEGHIAVSYIRSSVDPETGYPLIPDQISYLTAIKYYIKWKLAEYYNWNGREGFAGIEQREQEKWLKYVKQAKNFSMMPKTLDQFQNLLEQGVQLVPDHTKYYSYFGNLGRAEDRKFNDPDRRNR